ncbi:MAG: hypothetical protein GXP31_10850 [Kiritimatiellaeota bacterium]|nr:hypothetical protein [Kiritimatiellota bacterium]
MNRTARRLFVLFGSAAPLLQAAAGTATFVRSSQNRVRLGNARLEILLATDGPVRLLELKDNAAGAVLRFADRGFEFRFATGSPAIAKDFRITAVVPKHDEKASVRVVFRLEDTKRKLEARLVYELTAGDFFLRRRLALRSTRKEGGPLLREAVVEHLEAPEPVPAVPMGQPVFVGGRAFFGLEYPAGRTRSNGNTFALYHLPGKRLGTAFLDFKTEVLGVAGTRPLADAFEDYIRRIRIPPRNFILYNSWYDIRRNQMSTGAFEACFRSFQKQLIEPFGVKLDSFVIDDGWQNKNSIWETDKQLFPNDFGELALFLRANGSNFGLWMPLTPIRHNLNLDWGRKNGYEVTDSGASYCISAPRFNQAERDVIARHETEFGLNYYKHDFNQFRCAARGHGHLPEADFGFEANVDAYLRMLDYERTLNPRIFINITSSMWLSPWWLMYADTVWRGGGDTGRERVVPYVELRDDTMTYVDGVLWDRFVREALRFPPSALMTHGIVYGKLNRLGGGHEPLHRWTEHVIQYLAPGVMMKELYLTPNLLSDRQWRVLGKALAWAAAEAPLMARSRMTHGNPHKGELYGFVHTDPASGRLLWFLRNPSMLPQTAAVDLAEQLGGQPTSAAVIYPYRLELPAEKTVGLTVPPFQALVLSAKSAIAKDRGRTFEISGGRWCIERRTSTEIQCRLLGEPGPANRVFRVHAPAPIAEVLLDGVPLPLPPGRSDFAVDLRFPGQWKPATAKALETDAASGVNQFDVSLPPGTTDAYMALLCRGRTRALPFADFRVDGKTLQPRTTSGPDWRLLLLPLPEGRHRVEWKLATAHGAKTPFAARFFRLSVHLLARTKLADRSLVIRFRDPIPMAPAPPTPFADVQPVSMTVRPEHRVESVRPDAARGLAEEDLKNIRAAKLRLLTFDVNSEKQYRNKPVLLNGKPVGLLPANRPPIAQWEEHILDIPKDLLKSLKIEKNRVVFTNAGGDCYKVTGIALAVQLPDGTWVESGRDRRIYSSVDRNWKYFEGEPFGGNRSREIFLSFPRQ